MCQEKKNNNIQYPQCLVARGQIYKVTVQQMKMCVNVCVHVCVREKNGRVEGERRRMDGKFLNYRVSTTQSPERRREERRRREKVLPSAELPPAAKQRRNRGKGLKCSAAKQHQQKARDEWQQLLVNQSLSSKYRAAFATQP